MEKIWCVATRQTIFSCNDRFCSCTKCSECVRVQSTSRKRHIQLLLPRFPTLKRGFVPEQHVLHAPMQCPPRRPAQVVLRCCYVCHRVHDLVLSSLRVHLHRKIGFH